MERDNIVYIKQRRETREEQEDVVWWVNGTEGEGAETWEGGGEGQRERLPGEPAEVRRCWTGAVLASGWGIHSLPSFKHNATDFFLLMYSFDKILMKVFVCGYIAFYLVLITCTKINCFCKECQAK